METFDFLSYDDDANKKPRVKDNIKSVTGMMKDIEDNEKYDLNENFHEDNADKDEDELGCNEEEEDGEKNKVRKREKDKRDDGG